MFTTSSNLRYLYPFSLALILSPLMEAAVRLWPLQLHLVQWRFQSELALLNLTTLVLLGLLIAGLVAWATQATGILKAVAATCVLMGLCLLPVLGVFLYDGSQVQQMAQSAVRGALRNNTYVAFLKGALFMLGAFAMGVGFWRVAAEDALGTRRRDSGRKEPNGDDVLLVSADR